MTSPDPARFQVDLRGMIDLLSRSLYSSPDVFIRELLQNSADALQARRGLEPGFAGSVTVELVKGKDGGATLIFTDDGVGLTVDEIGVFLATIGASSKRNGAADRPSDYLGQFGIGLLASFLVTDEIVVVTRSARPGPQVGLEWRGKSDGTYETRPLAHEVAVGTQVFIRAKPEFAETFEKSSIEELLRHFGEYLADPIQFVHGKRRTTINKEPPWEQLDAPRETLLELGQQIFETEFLDALPIRSEAGGARGVAFVSPTPLHAGAQQSHRVYLKGMLVSDHMQEILPDWTFFVRVVLSATQLRPTASREGFYENRELDLCRQELGEALKAYLKEIGQKHPERLAQLLAVHHLAIKSLSLEDDECLAVFADALPFETSFGTMTFGEFRRQHAAIRYVSSADTFRQLSPVAAAEQVALINAGYVYDAELLGRLKELRPELDIEEFQAEQLADRFDALSLDEREETYGLARVAQVVLQPFQCDAEVVKFKPAELPALFVADAHAELRRSIDQSREVSDELMSGILSRLEEGYATAASRLMLNYHNPLIKRLAIMEDREGQRRCVELLYIQALLMGHVPLRFKETQLLNRGLIGMIDWALGRTPETDDER